MRVALFLILGLFGWSLAYSGDVIDLDAYRKQKSLQDSETTPVDKLNGRRPSLGGSQQVYDQAYEFVHKPIVEGGMGMGDEFAHDWASVMADSLNSVEFSEWRKRYWKALEFALKRGDQLSLAAGWAWDRADHSTSKEIDEIIAKHYGWSRPFYQFGEKYRKLNQPAPTPHPATVENGNARSNVIEVHPATAPKAKPEPSILSLVLEFNSHSANRTYEESREDAKILTDKLFEYFKNRHEGLSKNTDKETRELLSSMFRTLGKIEIEAMRSSPHFDEMMKLIYDDSVWKAADPTLLHEFIYGSWFYSLRYNDRELGSFLGKIDPNHPVIRNAIYDLKLPYSTPPHGLSKKLDRQGIIGNIITSMLREAPYRGTPAGEKLLQHVYEMWTELGFGLFGKILRDDMTPKLLSLLDLPEWRNHRILAKIAKVPPQPRQYSKALEEYEELKKKHPDVFPSQAGHAPASAPASPPTPEQTAECMKDMINYILDPFGFFKK